jgi:hypothetical protein
MAEVGKGQLGPALDSRDAGVVDDAGVLRHADSDEDHRPQSDDSGCSLTAMPTTNVGSAALLALILFVRRRRLGSPVPKLAHQHR